MTGGAISVGVLGGGPPTAVDPTGAIAPSGAAWTCEWWVGADDRWRIPANEVAVRQQRVGDVPVVETSMRVPGGDAVQRVYGVSGAGQAVVVDVENQSPAPFVVAFVLRGASRVAAEGTHAMIDGAFVCSWVRAPSRWAKTVGSPVQIPVTTGHAVSGPFPRVRDRAGRLEVAFLHPVAHRTTLRMVVSRAKSVPSLDLRALPDVASVVTGWGRQLDRGMQVRLPDRRLDERLRAARAEVLLRGQAQRPDPRVVAALEDWGFDAEAEDAWRRLGTRDRRRAASRSGPASWAALEQVVDDAELLLAARALLVHESGRDPGPMTLCADYPESWRGQPLEVRDAPVIGGRVSYAVRWHGARPAVLWEVPPGVSVRMPALDPAWVSRLDTGESLLGPVSGVA